MKPSRVFEEIFRTWKNFEEFFRKNMKTVEINWKFKELMEKKLINFGEM